MILSFFSNLQVSFRILAVASLLGLLLSCDLTCAQGVTRIGGDISRDLLGDGTDVIVAVIDSGIDDTHPGLVGSDSLGNTRLVTEANFVPAEPDNSGDDIFGHGTAVASVMLGDDALVNGLAPDARYINARAIDRANRFNSTFEVLDAVGFAIENGAEVMNLSLNTSGEFSDGSLKLDRLLDWSASELGVISAVCAGNISQSNIGAPNVRSPAGSFNTIAVGWTSAPGYNQVNPNSSIGDTVDGRIKPDVVAPGDRITTFNDDWETQSDYDVSSGCSFATPHVSGLLAQQIDYGKSNGLSTNPLVLKATMLNSADKSLVDKSGDGWEPFASAMADGVFTVTSALDDELGAGQVDGVSLYEQYRVGEQEAGLVDEIGWDLDTIEGTGSAKYFFVGQLQGGTSLTATLTWFREVNYVDNGDGTIDSSDVFNVLGELDNLNLSLLLDGNVIATSMSSIDNVEHLFFVLPESGEYSLRIDRLAVVNSGVDTEFGIAWSATSFSLGDVNRNGVVNFLDVLPFINLLAAGDFLDEADTDRNGTVDFLDISSFVAILSGQ